MARNEKDKDTDTKHAPRQDSDATGSSGSDDREPKRTSQPKRASDDVTDIGTDAQQADGTAAGPSTS